MNPRRHVPHAPPSIRGYEIVRALGMGGMATVYLARTTGGERRGRREVAIKCMHDFMRDDPDSCGALESEARLASTVRHPNVVGIVEMVEERGAPAIVMEWIDGLDLSMLTTAIAKSGGRLPLDVSVAIVRDVLEGLHAVHEARCDDGARLEIIHRDVSPQNILVGIDGIARLTDFGIATAAGEAPTELGTINGKLGYMAPEQLEGRCDRRTDVYGAAVVLWELLSGRNYRSTGGGAQVLVEILKGAVRAPSEHVPVAAPLDDVILRALARDPAERYGTTREMAQCLVDRVTPASRARVAEVLSGLLYDSTSVRGGARRRRRTGRRGGLRPRRGAFENAVVTQPTIRLDALLTQPTIRLGVTA